MNGGGVVGFYETVKNKTRKRRHHHHIPLRYLPKTLTVRDKRKQLQSVKQSRRMYKKGRYFIRPTIRSFTSKRSKHIKKARQIYGVDVITSSPLLSNKTGCTVSGLQQIVNKGEGAYYSSGSRPNQTPQSWGIARLASAITGGPASKIDYNILKNHCNPNSKALLMAIPPASS